MKLISWILLQKILGVFPPPWTKRALFFHLVLFRKFHCSSRFKIWCETGCEFGYAWSLMQLLHTYQVTAELLLIAYDISQCLAANFNVPITDNSKVYCLRLTRSASCRSSPFWHAVVARDAFWPIFISTSFFQSYLQKSRGNFGIPWMVACCSFSWKFEGKFKVEVFHCLRRYICGNEATSRYVQGSGLTKRLFASYFRIMRKCYWLFIFDQNSGSQQVAAWWFREIVN